MYESLVARRISYDQLMWQVPALGLAAQAFLIGTGVNEEAPWPVQAVALLMAVGVGLLSLQLMGKQRFHEQLDTRFLEAWEESHHDVRVKGFVPHNPATGVAEYGGQTKAEAFGVTAHRFVLKSSYRFWVIGLACFTTLPAAVLLWKVWAATLGR